MKQQVNLYQDKFKPKKIRFSAHHAVAVFSLLLLALTLLSFYFYYQKNTLEQQVKQKKDVLAKLEQQNQSFEDKIKQKKSHETSIEKENKLLLKKIQRYREILKYLSNQKNIESIAFSAYLQDMAKAASRNIAVDKLIIRNKEHYFSISGKTRKQQYLSAYIEKLASLPSFRAVKFRYITIEKDEQKENLYWFKMSSQREKESQPGNAPATPGMMGPAGKTLKNFQGK